MDFKLSKDDTQALSELADSFYTIRNTLAEFLDALTANWESEFDSKSEEWRRSEAGAVACKKLRMLYLWREKLRHRGSDLQRILARGLT